VSLGRARRIVSAVRRVEQTPYDFTPDRRLPRLASASGIRWCVPSSSIAAGTNPPSGSPGGPLTGQTIYRISAGAYVALGGTYSVYNPRTAAVTSGKLAAVVPNDDNTYSVIDWDC
jgi:hypothetical protein